MKNSIMNSKLLVARNNKVMWIDSQDLKPTDKLQETKVKNKFEKMLNFIEKKKEKELGELIKIIPLSNIDDFIWKLERYKYQKYPYTAMALKKLKERKRKVVWPKTNGRIYRKMV